VVERAFAWNKSVASNGACVLLSNLSDTKEDKESPCNHLLQCL
jgi:hypothetical protein